MSIVVLPIFVNEIIIAYGLRILLSDNGLVNFILLTLGLVDKPLRILYTDTAIVIGLIYTQIPYATLILISTLTSIDRRCIEAAKTLNASARALR
jgi:spermidine/putrescine transport system permease protein